MPVFVGARDGLGVRPRALGHRGGWRKTEAQLSVCPRGLRGAEERTFRDRQDADSGVVEVKGTQAMGMSWAEAADDAWVEFGDRATGANRRPSQRIVSQLRRFPVLAVLVAVVGLTLAGCGIGSNRGPNSGAGDDNPFFPPPRTHTPRRARGGG